jgi:hypothetical protein
MSSCASRVTELSATERRSLQKSLEREQVAAGWSFKRGSRSRPTPSRSSLFTRNPSFSRPVTMMTFFVTGAVTTVQNATYSLRSIKKSAMVIILSFVCQIQ